MKDNVVVQIGNTFACRPEDLGSQPHIPGKPNRLVRNSPFTRNLRQMNLIFIESSQTSLFSPTRYYINPSPGSNSKGNLCFFLGFWKFFTRRVYSVFGQVGTRRTRTDDYSSIILHLCRRSRGGRSETRLPRLRYDPRRVSSVDPEGLAPVFPRVTLFRISDRGRSILDSNDACVCTYVRVYVCVPHVSTCVCLRAYMCVCVCHVRTHVWGYVCARIHVCQVRVRGKGYTKRVTCLETEP